MTQNEQILQHLRDHGSITALEAMEQYHCFRLAARISNLREAGARISSEMVAVKRDGKVVHFVKYRLESK